MAEDLKFGQDQANKDATDAYDAAHGKHKCNVDPNASPDQKFATGNMPMAADPKPFKLNGGQAAGE